MRHNNRGFTISEVIMTAIMAAIFAAGGTAFNVAVRANTEKAIDIYQATDLASCQIEDLKQIAKDNFGDAALSNGTHAATSRVAAIIPTAFSVSYIVADGTDWPEDDAGGADTGGAEYKKITVTCTNPANRQVQLKTYIIK
jgi:hypothetical protein